MTRSTLKRNDKGQFLPKNGGGGSVAPARITRTKILKGLKRNGMTESMWLDKMIVSAPRDRSSKDFINKILYPSYKAEQQPIKFNIEGAGLVQKAENILAEVGRGKLSIENGTQLLRALKELGSLIEFEELASKLEKIENQIAKGFTQVIKDQEGAEDDWD